MLKEWDSWQTVSLNVHFRCAYGEQMRAPPRIEHMASRWWENFLPAHVRKPLLYCPARCDVCCDLQATVHLPFLTFQIAAFPLCQLFLSSQILVLCRWLDHMSWGEQTEGSYCYIMGKTALQCLHPPSPSYCDKILWQRQMGKVLILAYHSREIQSTVAEVTWLVPSHWGKEILA